MSLRQRQENHEYPKLKISLGRGLMRCSGGGNNDTISHCARKLSIKRDSSWYVFQSWLRSQLRLVSLDCLWTDPAGRKGKQSSLQSICYRGSRGICLVGPVGDSASHSVSGRLHGPEASPRSPCPAGQWHVPLATCQPTAGTSGADAPRLPCETGRETRRGTLP